MFSTLVHKNDDQRQIVVICTSNAHIRIAGSLRKVVALALQIKEDAIGVPELVLIEEEGAGGGAATTGVVVKCGLDLRQFDPVRVSCANSDSATETPFQIALEAGVAIANRSSAEDRIVVLCQNTAICRAFEARESLNVRAINVDLIKIHNRAQAAHTKAYVAAGRATDAGGNTAGDQVSGHGAPCADSVSNDEVDALCDETSSLLRKMGDVGGTVERDSDGAC